MRNIPRRLRDISMDDAKFWSPANTYRSCQQRSWHIRSDDTLPDETHAPMSPGPMYTWDVAGLSTTSSLGQGKGMKPLLPGKDGCNNVIRETSDEWMWLPYLALFDRKVQRTNHESSEVYLTGLRHKYGAHRSRSIPRKK